MDKIQKLLAKIPSKDKIGSYRIKFYLERDGQVIIIGVERRGSHTY